MSKKRENSFGGENFDLSSFQATNAERQDKWQIMLRMVAHRFNRHYQGETFDLPPEVKAMPIFREWSAGLLPGKITSYFWEIAQGKRIMSIR